MSVPLVLDFTGVRNATGSLFDEILGRLAAALDPDEFHRRVRIAGLEPLVRPMANVVIE